MTDDDARPCRTCQHRAGYHFRKTGECAFVNDEQDTCRCQHFVAPEDAAPPLLTPVSFGFRRRCPTCGHVPGAIDGDRDLVLFRIVRTWQDRQTVAEQMFAEVINRAFFDGKDLGRTETIDDLIEYLREIR
jgi:hypothetical protein